MKLPASSTSALLLLAVTFGAIDLTAATSVTKNANTASIAGSASIRKKTANHESFRSQPTAEVSLSKAQATTIRGGSAPQKDAISGVIIMTLIERAVNKILKSNGINFPSQLGGCAFLFFFLLLSQGVSSGLGDTIADSLNPGAALVSKWLPSLFVPGLAMLPLAPSIGNTFEILKVVSVVILGFVYTLSTVSFSVLFLRAAQGKLKKGGGTGSFSSSGPVKKPFSEMELSFLSKGSIITGAVYLGSKVLMDGKHSTPLGTVFFMFTTLAAYVWGARLPTSFVKVVHPLITSTVMLWTIMNVVGKVTGDTFVTVLKTYKVGSLDLAKTGAGDLLLFLLGPSVVSFALAMYGRKKLLKENLSIVLSGSLVASVGGLFGTAAFVRAINLGGKYGKTVRVSVLARNVTTALSMAIASMLGGDIAIAATAVVFTGIIGATYGKTLLNAMGINDPVTRGLGLGASAQGLGVAALSNEPDAFPFAAMSMVLNAIFATTLVSIPPCKDALVKLATGG